ncbi:VOC family protein [Amycolatopsis sp. VS8301801F10]|uniref:VOC family protein n=1 Tax=Amycolatopsis sp. VS8301801F10 TaxID=2652442 RepID=UPI0038FC6A2B
MFEGLRTIVYPVGDLAAAKEWWTRVLGVPPYFDEPFYVGYSVHGYELALDPNGRAENGDGPVTYWGVPDVEAALAKLVGEGAAEHAPVTDFGGGIRTALVRAPDGNLVGVIENPHFPGTPA